MFNMQKMMKQAQEMQARLQEVQEKMKDITVEGQSGAGMVKILITCDGIVKNVSLDDSLMTDKETLEDLIAAAMNNANQARDERIKQETQGVMQGFGLPDGVKLPF